MTFPLNLFLSIRRSVLVIGGIVISIMLAGCIIFTSPHNRFIDGMDTLVGNSQRMKTTIDDYLYKNEDPMLSKKYVVKHETVGNHLVYHYAIRIYSECYFHVFVDKKTRLLVGWGFDKDKGNPKACVMVG